jgi:hypothetical protein
MPDFNFTQEQQVDFSTSSSSDPFDGASAGGYSPTDYASFNRLADPVTGDVSYGSGSRVYLIDTGCKTDHREFKPQGRANIVYSRFQDGIVGDPNGERGGKT